MTLTIRLETDAKWAMRLARVAVALRHVIGNDRAFRLAYWAAYRFARWRVGNGRWRRGLTGYGACCKLIARGVA